MKRLHINIQVEELAAARSRYQALLGSEPTFEKEDYAKWELDDPALTLSITDRGNTPGLDHLGIKFDDESEMQTVLDRLHAADEMVRAERNATCCYANSDKGWWQDPTGLSWELFVTHQQVDEFGGGTTPPRTDSAEGTTRRSACC